MPFRTRVRYVLSQHEQRIHMRGCVCEGRWLLLSRGLIQHALRARFALRTGRSRSHRCSEACRRIGHPSVFVASRAFVNFCSPVEMKNRVLRMSRTNRIA